MSLPADPVHRMPVPRPARLDHVNLEVGSLGRARRFYDRILPRLGFRRLPAGYPAWVGYRGGGMTLWLTESRPARVVRQPPHVPTDGKDDPISDHLGFRVGSGARVRQLEGALRRAGLRPVYGFDRLPQGSSWYISCAFRDPDENVLEIYAVTPRRRR